MYDQSTLAHNIYLFIQFFTVACAIWLIVKAAVHRPSKGQGQIMLFLFSALIYLVGFSIEAIAVTEEGYYLACLTEYFGEALVFIAFFHFVTLLCKMKIPRPIYIAQWIISTAIVYMVMSTRQNHFFYKEIYVIEDGPFPHLGLTYGPGFFMTISYIGILTIVSYVIVARYITTASEIERKRCYCTIISITCAWVPYIAKLLGLTGGYEIPGPGMCLAGFWLVLAMEKYGFMDSLVLAGEKIMDSGQSAIVVIDSKYRYEYSNNQLDTILGQMAPLTDVRTIPTLRKIIAGNFDPVKFEDRIYDVNVDELYEKGYLQGYMISFIDNTDHYNRIDEIKEMARRDSFTGLLNRISFQEDLEDCLSKGHCGTFVMMDVDNFKQVNDKYGHAVGDEILKLLADILLELDTERFLTSRLGGDEFAAFFIDIYDNVELSDILGEILDSFSQKLEEKGYGGYTNISMGAVAIPASEVSGSRLNFDRLYRSADEMMYEVKHSGKGKFYIKGSQNVVG